MSDMSSKSKEQHKQLEPKEQLRGGLPFTVGATQWHESSWASLKPNIKTAMPTLVQGNNQTNHTNQTNQTKSISISSHQRLHGTPLIPKEG